MFPNIEGLVRRPVWLDAYNLFWLSSFERDFIDSSHGRDYGEKGVGIM